MAGGGDEFPEVALDRRGPRVALAGGRLGYLAPDALLVWSLADGKQVTRASLAEPRALAAMNDGAFLAIDSAGRNVCRVAPGADKAECWPAVIPIPRPGVARLFGDAKEADRFWVIGDRAILGWRTKLVGAHLGSAGRLEYSDVSAPGKQPLVVALAGGDFLALHYAALEVITADDKRRKLAWPGGPNAAVAGPGAAQAWVLSGDGSLGLVDLVDPPSTTVAVQRDGNDKVIYSLASSATHVAALALDHKAPRTGKPLWSLVVWDNAGKATRRLELPWQPTVTDTDETELSIALSAKPSLVAVGSEGRVVVWDIGSGKVVFEHTLP